MHHARAQNLQPARIFAQPATGAAAEHAVHIHLDAWLGEGEVGLAEANLPPRAVHLVGEVEQRALEVAEGDIVADGQTLHLIEHHFGARRHIFFAETFARQDDAHRLRRVVAHGVNLAWAGVRAQNDIFLLCEEGVLHLARRVVGREVEQPEVIIVSLHLRRVVNLETHLAQDGHDLSHRLVGGVQLADLWPASRQGHVDALGSQRGIHLDLGHGSLALLQRSFQHHFDLVGSLADQRALLGSQLAHPAQDGRHLAFAAQIVGVPRLGRRRGVRLRQRSQRILLKLGEFLHQVCHQSTCFLRILQAQRIALSSDPMAVL